MQKVWFFLMLVMGSFHLAQAQEFQVIYGVSPYYFSRGHEGTFFKNLEARLPELKELGIHVLWVQPIFPSATEGQSYDIVDFWRVNPAYGTSREFKNLIQKAHGLKIKVILDIALNHLPAAHPWVQDIGDRQKKSSYYDFFDHAISARDYSQFENLKLVHGQNFVYYFWESLFNLNYSNPRVREHAVSVLKFWVREYDVDGFRFDASWGIAARWNDFYRTVRFELKNEKEDILILAEDNAYHSDLNVNSGDMTGVNWGYDWEAQDGAWVSKWAFQSGDEHHQTIFNEQDSTDAAKAFADILTHQMRTQRSTPLRYLQNNDTASFLESHGREQTVFAAGVMAFLPGPLLLFYGQAEGLNFPQWHLPSIDPNIALSAYDFEMWELYKGLIAKRKALQGYNGIRKVSRRGAKVTLWIGTQYEVIFDFEKRSIFLNNTEIL